MAYPYPHFTEHYFLRNFFKVLYNSQSQNILKSSDVTRMWHHVEVNDILNDTISKSFGNSFLLEWT